MAFSVMLWGAEKLVPAEYWCPYGMFYYKTLVLVLIMPTNKSLFRKLNAESPGDLLQLPWGVLLGVDLDASLGSAEGDVDDSTLVGHQRRQRLDFIFTYIFTVSDTLWGKE